MAGMEFEYDEKGGTFYYFLLSFLAFILIPVTYYLWPSDKSEGADGKGSKDCRCLPCQMKRQSLRSSQPWQKAKKRLIQLLILLGWLLFAYIAYRASQVEIDWTDFDPYKELEVDRGATDRQIKKAYRQLSLIYHPDRDTGDAHKFMKISKAYQALTDEESRKNWEEYGNPDGPGVTQFGIALPKWIVEKQNSIWVLAVYGLLFMVVLPVAVGSWWYRSIKYSAEQILMDTMQLYRFFIHKTPNMVLKRVIMILGASFEFSKTHNNEVTARPSDNEEVPQLMKRVPQLQEKTKEAPLGYPYSVKARTLLHAHFSRIELNGSTLQIDKEYILNKCNYLLNEMINIAAMLVAMGHARKVAKIPRLDTIENMMRLSQMIVQAMWDNKSSLLQLPHITEDNLRHFVTRKRSIRSIQQLVKMKDEERRKMLGLDEMKYRDVMNVCAKMPLVNMNCEVKVLDDEDSNVITAGSIVTVQVTLTRRNLSELFDKETLMNGDIEAVEDILMDEGEDMEEEEVEEDNEEEAKDDAKDKETAQKKQTKVWEKQQKKKKGKGGKKGKKLVVKQQHFVKKQSAVTTVTAAGDEKVEGDSTVESNNTSSPSEKDKKPPVKEAGEGENSSDSQVSDAEDDSGEENQDLGKDAVEDDDWLDFDEAKKDSVLETKSKETHEVHCPYYPSTKYEWWWVFVADKRTHSLITAPVQLCSLRDEEEVQLKFSAPVKVGKYKYNVILKSDSYVADFDQIQNFEIDVKEARKVESHPQWKDVPSDEDEDATDSDSDYSYSDSNED